MIKLSGLKVSRQYRVQQRLVVLFRDLGLPRLRRTRKRAPRQLTLFGRPEPGDCVQVDVKFVKLGTRWAFQYTALDDCTRFRVLRLYPRLGQAHDRFSLAIQGRTPAEKLAALLPPSHAA